MPEVSVVILTKDKPQYLERCLKYLKNQTYRKFEIVVVDTGNPDSERISRKYGAKYVLQKRLGFGTARNLGIKAARGEFILFLVDEVIIPQKSFVETILKSFINAGTGAVGAIQKPVHKAQNFSFSRRLYGFFIGNLSPFSRMQRIGIRSSGRVTGNFRVKYNGITEVPHLRGYFFAFRKKALEEIKGFDEYFNRKGHREDTDVCYRLTEKGYKILLNPGVFCVQYPDVQNENLFFNLHSMYEQHQYLVFKNRLLKPGGVIEYLVGEALEIFSSILLVLLMRDLRYFLLIKAKLTGILEGIKARHVKGVYGDLE